MSEQKAPLLSTDAFHANPASAPKAEADDDHGIHLALPQIVVPSDSDGEDYVKPPAGEYTNVFGNLPMKAPNVRFGHEEEDIARAINGEISAPSTFFEKVAKGLCCMTGVGCLYLWSKMVLVNQGELGLSMNNGTPQLILPGRHVLGSPLNQLETVWSVSQNLFSSGPVTIVRVPQGSLGFGMNNSKPEILLPGLHVRNSGQFVYGFTKTVSEELIEYGPIKIMTVQSGYVRVCFVNGKVCILSEGRYAVNYPTFQVGGKLNIQIQALRFNEHKVMLDGGISMLVEGLLTYRIIHVEKLIKQIGVADVVRSIENVTEAEISRVFSSIHLEQIASAYNKDGGHQGEDWVIDDREGETRSKICHCIIQAIKPIVEPWGIKIINFQINSLTLADIAFAKDYESASLAVSKAKAGLRAASAENEIMITKARAAADATRIQSEGQKDASITQAKAQAESKTLLATAEARAMVLTAEADASSRKIEASARNEAAEAMKNEFARSFALAGQQVEFARALKANSLTVLNDSVVGKPIVSNLLNSHVSK